MTEPDLPAPRDGVEDYGSATAEEFLDVLSPRNNLWASDPPSWIFRGQANAEWELKAKAVRDHGAFAEFGIKVASTTPGYVAPDNQTWYERVGLQNRLLGAFRAGLDQSGLPIPAKSPAVAWREEITSNAEPPRDAFPLMALAQHHGLPTMLLDWTRRAWVAAYFGASDAAGNGGKGATCMAVWALQRGDLVNPSEGPLFYEAPGGTNPNLAAQAGLFTLHIAEDDPSLEVHFARTKRITGSVPMLMRLTLPTREAPKLLRLLSYEGISGASMFPGADGVVKAMRERALWDCSPP